MDTTNTPTPRTDAEERDIFAVLSEGRISAKQAIRAMAAGSRRLERELAEVRASRPMTLDAEASDPINPSHYGAGSGGIECIDAIEAALGREAAANFCRGNAIKYLWRGGKKDATEQDLRKAIWYIEKEIELRAPDHHEKGAEP